MATDSIPHNRRRRHALDFDTVDRLHHEGHSYRKIAQLLNTNYQAVYRAHHHPPTNGTPTTTLQRVEIAGEPFTPDEASIVPTNRDSSAELKAQLDALAAEVADLKAHRLEIDAWIATLQAQSRDTAQHYAEVRGAEQRSLAQTYAEPAQTWDDPEDAKAVPFNCSLPRGLKRLLDAEAKRTGFPMSKLVQRLLLAALAPQEGRHDA